VAVAQLVEPRVVVPVVGGSSPLRHPSLLSELGRVDLGGQVPPNERVDQLLLAPDELDAVALERLAVRPDGSHGLSLVDEASNLLGKRLDCREMKNFR
jgi:hypothetical protein